MIEWFDSMEGQEARLESMFGNAYQFVSGAEIRTRVLANGDGYWAFLRTFTEVRAAVVAEGGTWSVPFRPWSHRALMVNGRAWDDPLDVSPSGPRVLWPDGGRSLYGKFIAFFGPEAIPSAWTFRFEPPSFVPTLEVDGRLLLHCVRGGYSGNFVADFSPWHVEWTAKTYDPATDPLGGHPTVYSGTTPLTAGFLLNPIVLAEGVTDPAILDFEFLLPD